MGQEERNPGRGGAFYHHMIVGASGFLRDLRKGVEARQRMLEEQEALQERIRQEMEKLRLETLLKNNPELAKDVEAFKASYPQSRLLEGAISSGAESLRQ